MGAIFGVIVGAMLLAVWLSGEAVLQKLGLLLLADWASTNVAVNMLGFDQAPLLIPTLNAVVAILVATVGYANKSRIALAVLAVYGLIGTAHIAAFILHRQGTYTYYASLNVLFFLQLVIVGAPGAWLAVRRWSPPSRQRAGADRARRADLGARE